MRYNINGRLIYNATDGTLTLAESEEPDTQLSITASALLYFFVRNTGIVTRDEVLKKVWDDNGLTSSNSNLNQYLSMLRKTFRHYGIDNIIVTVSRGHLQFNPDVVIDLPQHDPGAEDTPPAPAPAQPAPALITAGTPVAPGPHGTCWYFAGLCLMIIGLLLLVMSFFGEKPSRPIALTPISHSACELLASDEMLRSVAAADYSNNFDTVRKRLNLACKKGERFVFFYGDRLETNGLGRVFLAHCAMHQDNPFSYCDNYFYYSWKPQ